MELRVYNHQDRVTVLGPGVRYVVWTQGCKRRCPGCMTPKSQSLTGGTLWDPQTLGDVILASGREGITISGGEPFLQAQALGEMIGYIRSKRDVGVIIYTGNTLEALKKSPDPHIRALLDQCDLLIDGEYIESLNDGRNLRGSSNQRAIPLTPRYAREAELYGTKPAEVEFFFREEKISMVGVPPAGMLERFQNIQF